MHGLCTAAATSLHHVTKHTLTKKLQGADILLSCGFEVAAHGAVSGQCSVRSLRAWSTPNDNARPLLPGYHAGSRPSHAAINLTCIFIP
jgi:hypothetical protein